MKNGTEIRPNGLEIRKIMGNVINQYYIMGEFKSSGWDFLRNARRYADQYQLVNCKYAGGEVMRHPDVKVMVAKIDMKVSFKPISLETLSGMYNTTQLDDFYTMPLNTEFYTEFHTLKRVK